MSKLSSILTLLIQVFITSIVLFIVYIIYALNDVDEADMVNGIAFIVFQPLFGFILTSITIAACLLIGLPIRIVKRLKQWWYAKPLLPILGVFTGLCLLVLAFLPAWTEIQQVIIHGEPTQKQVPNAGISLAGWFITAFSLLHFYPQSLLNLFRCRKVASA